MDAQNREIEVRFLEIDKDAIIQKLISLGATDLGEELLDEIIFYDKDLVWKDEGKKLVRIRSNSKKSTVTYKNQFEHSATGTIEYEFIVDNAEQARLFLNEVGLQQFRHQQKRRHTFQLGAVTCDIDTWPTVPTYIELEGPSEEALKDAAAKLDLDWNKVIFENPRIVLEKYYNVPVGGMSDFTFEKVG